MSKKIIFFLIFILIVVIVFFILLSKRETSIANFFFKNTVTQEQFFQNRKTASPTSIDNQFPSSYKSSPTTTLSKLNDLLPVETADFKLEYSKSQNKYILTKKTSSAYEKMTAWLIDNNFSALEENRLITKNPASENLTGPVSPNITNPVSTSSSSTEGRQQYYLLLDLLKSVAVYLNQPTATPSPIILEPTINQTNSDTGSFDNLGLPNPVADGTNGYLTLKNKIEANSNALWATKQLLEGEKIYKSKGGNIIPYLTTAWIWFENGASSWPDPYEINCNDDRAGYYSEVSFFCNSNNFQVAGYQAAGRKSDYIQVFSRLYSDSDFRSIMQNVIDNSYHASKNKWNYKDNGQNKGLITRYLADKSIFASLTLNDISPNGNFFDEKAQFFTLILGKDPKMAVALNSYAVNSGFLNQLKNANDSKKLYGYIGNREVQLISNMIAALYMIDTGSLPSSGGFSGGGNIVAWANQISNNLTAGQICDGWNCRQTNSISNGSYSAAIRQGYDNSLATSGRYWCTQLPIDSYNLAGKKGLNNSHAGIVGMIQFWKNTSGYKYLDYSGGSSRQQILNQLQPGCAMFQESKHGVHTGYEHAAIIKDVSIKNGDGYIITYDANGPQKTSRYIIDNWQVINNFYSYVSFGC